jgi:NCS1 family nucleobase:cation symporter-1
VVAIAVSLIGLFVPGLRFLWDNAWTIGLLVAGAVYVWLMQNSSSILTSQEYKDMTIFENSDIVGDLAPGTVKPNA